MELLSKISLIRLNQIIEKTKSQLFLCLPAIPLQTAKAIIELENRVPGVKINLLVDFDPQTFRQGYGEFDAVTNLRDAGFTLSNLPDNRISFVISDNTGFYLFIESQYLVPAEKETMNAIHIDGVSLVKLKQHFFNSHKNNYEDELSNAIIEVSQELKTLEETKVPPPPANTKNISADEYQIVNTDIQKNPPMEPDHKRMLNVYTNKFQYVDLSFSGVNIQDKEVSIPKDLLPIKDENLRNQLKSSLKVFDKDKETKDFEGLKTLNIKLNEIREKYLVHSSVCNRNILKIDDKEQFKQDIENLKNQLPNLYGSIIGALNDELEKTQERFKKEIYDLVMSEPEIVFGKNSLWAKDMRLLEQAAKKKTNDVIKKIRWPDYFKLVAKMDIKTFYSDIAYDDLFNDELLKEFEKKELILEADVKKLADFKSAIQVSQKK
jgi:hypothetical protein